MGEKKAIYDVQPLRTRGEIEDMKYSLRRWCGERDLFMFVCGINTGLRVSDIVTLKVADVRDKTHVRIVEQKSGKVRNVNLKALQPEITEYTRGMRRRIGCSPHVRATVISRRHRRIERS